MKSLEKENVFRDLLHLGLVKDPEPYFPHDDTSFSKDVAKAAITPGNITKQVVCDIVVYVARDQACHKDVKNLIHKYHWHKLAELLSSTSWLYNRYSSVMLLDSRRGGQRSNSPKSTSSTYTEMGRQPVYVLTDFANKKTKKQIAKLAKGPETGPQPRSQHPITLTCERTILPTATNYDQIHSSFDLPRMYAAWLTRLHQQTSACRDSVLQSTRATTDANQAPMLRA